MESQSPLPCSQRSNIGHSLQRAKSNPPTPIGHKTLPLQHGSVPLIQKPMASQLVKKLPSSYANRRFITTFAEACKCTQPEPDESTDRISRCPTGFCISILYHAYYHPAPKSHPYRWTFSYIDCKHSYENVMRMNYFPQLYTIKQFYICFQSLYDTMCKNFLPMLLGTFTELQIATISFFIPGQSSSKEKFGSPTGRIFMN
jgi:hypothetical protein